MIAFHYREDPYLTQLEGLEDGTLPPISDQESTPLEAEPETTVDKISLDPESIYNHYMLWYLAMYLKDGILGAAETGLPYMPLVERVLAMDTLTITHQASMENKSQQEHS